MKYSVLLLALAAFATAVLGFGLLSDLAATICRVLFLALFVLTAFVLFRSSRVRRAVPGTFATSFKSEPEDPARIVDRPT
jgi:uncharacterized membrane protein YfcA